MPADLSLFKNRPFLIFFIRKFLFKIQLVILHIVVISIWTLQFPLYWCYYTWHPFNRFNNNCFCYYSIGEEFTVLKKGEICNLPKNSLKSTCINAQECYSLWSIIINTSRSAADVAFVQKHVCGYLVWNEILLTSIN